MREILILMADTNPSDSLAAWTSVLYNLGGFGLLLFLLLTGKLVTKSQHDEVRADRDAYKHSFEILRDDKRDDLDRDQVMLRLMEEIKAAQDRAQ